MAIMNEEEVGLHLSSLESSSLLRTPDLVADGNLLFGMGRERTSGSFPQVSSYD